MFSMKRYGAENGDLFICECKEYLQGRTGFVKALNESANWKWSKQGTNGRKRPSHYRKAEIDSISNPHAHQRPVSVIIISILDRPIFVLRRCAILTKLSVCMTVISDFLLFTDTKKIHIETSRQ